MVSKQGSFSLSAEHLLVAWFVTEASSLLPAGIQSGVWQGGVPAAPGTRAALAAAKDKGDECN